VISGFSIEMCKSEINRVFCFNELLIEIGVPKESV
jgi:hypothetical protein